MIYHTTHQSERGAVSLFIVIFSAILMSVITLSFLMLMIRDQQQATNNALSQNAYDAAMTGVEDAKRAIAFCGANPTGTGCDQIASKSCTTLEAISGLGIRFSENSNRKEYQIQSSDSDNTMNQAYTCVTIDPQPATYSSVLKENTPILIPLRFAGGAHVNEMTISWQMSGGNSTSVRDNSRNSHGIALALDTYANWNSGGYPPVLRAQLIRPSAISQPSASEGHTSSVFLYPTRSVSQLSTTFAAPAAGPQPAGCTGSVNMSCSVTITDGANAFNEGYLALMPIYGNAKITLSLPAGVTFDGVQSVVDSTGRAANLFRRVEARVDVIPQAVYPNAELVLGGPVCKNFAVTPTGYISGYNGTGTNCNSN